MTGTHAAAPSPVSGNAAGCRGAGAADDRRGVLITITPAGRDVLRSAVPVHAQTIRESLLDPLTPRGQDLLARALSRVAGG